MSNYEYVNAMGSNGDSSGAGAQVGASGTTAGGSGELYAFIDKLNTEKGPFVFIGKDSPEGKKFISWVTLYEPSFFDWLSKLAMVKMSAAALEVSEAISVIPEWVQGNTIRMQKSLYDMYLACSTRISNILAQQGKIVSTSLPSVDVESFLAWWKSYDAPGVYALISMYTVGEKPDEPAKPIEFPKKLYDFWKTTKGVVEPPKPLLGFGASWLDWALDNWLWLVGGAVGGMVVSRWYINKRSHSHDLRRTVLDMGEMDALQHGPQKNPRAHEGWGSEIKTKDGVFKLHPLIPDTQYRRIKAMNMKMANKFRVSSGGKSLGELHKSSGNRSWKAISYSGVQKFGNSRAALLGWLKNDAETLAMDERLAELSLPMPTMTTNRGR